MKFYSTRDHTFEASFPIALTVGLAPDGGLFMPSSFPKLSKKFLDNIQDNTFSDIAFEMSKTLLGDSFPEEELRNICNDAFNFSTPIHNLDENIYTMELFHGPTCAFKDFGARFMARVLSYYANQEQQKITILVATSGDTGSAVAAGFLDVPNIDVIILYPSKKVSHIQEQQLTTMGGNITAVEVKGTFDDCQKLVKEAFMDKDLKKLHLTSANSINIGRLIPQMFYYAYAYAQLKKNAQDLVVCVPSGNFGNLTAGLFAKQMGIPIKQFIAASNNNDTVVKYLKTGKFTPKPSVKTHSNAMDVGNPSNFERIQDLYKDNLKAVQADIWGISISDLATEKAIKDVYKTYNYLLDPHGAVGYAALTQYLKDHKKVQGVFFETAHPAKFAEVIEPLVKDPIPVPDQLQKYLKRKKISIKLNNDFKKLKKLLLK